MGAASGEGPGWDRAGAGSGEGPRGRRGAAQRLALVTSRPLTDLKKGAYFTGTAELSDNSDTSSSSTMLSRVSTRSGKALSRSALRSTASRVVVKDVRRSFVQPSGADRASVVDVPSSYQEDTAFAPRVGELSSYHRIVSEALMRLRRHVWLQARGNSSRGRRF